MYSFGAINRTRHLVVKNATYRQRRTHRDQTLLRGQHCGVSRVIQNFRDGFRYIAEMDIESCYQSFNSTRVGQLLALPERVTANSLGMHNLKLHPTPNLAWEWYHPSDVSSPEKLAEVFFHQFEVEIATALPGLIEGSMASPFVVEMLLAPTCRALRTANLGRVVCYADNFLLMAKSAKQLEAMEQRLRDELLAHPVGSHLVHLDRNSSPGSPFPFLGYQLVPERGMLRPEPGTKVLKNAKNLRKCVYKKLRSSIPLAEKRRIFVKTEEKHWTIVNSLRLWEGRKNFHNCKMRTFRRQLGISCPQGLIPERRS
ncbi:MAG: hypothetical protein AAFU56_02985 [Pseudomonadota bacterium]